MEHGPDKEVRHNGAKASADAELLARIRSGDAEAAVEFVQSHWAAILPLIKSRLHLGAMRRWFDSSDIRDSAARRIARLLVDGEVRAETVQQLQQLVSLSALSVIARRRKQTERWAKDTAAPIPISAPDPSDDAERVDHAEQVETMLRHLLKDSDREIVRLWMRGVPMETISQSVGMNRGRAEKRLERAIQRIRNVYVEAKP